MSEPVYRLVQKIAAEFGINASAVLAMAVNGTVPAIAPTPGRVLIHASSFRRWAAENPQRIADMRNGQHAVINRSKIEDRTIERVNARWTRKTPSKRTGRPLLNDSAENVTQQRGERPGSAVAQHWRAVAHELNITIDQLADHVRDLGFRSNRIDPIRFRMLMDRVARQRAAAKAQAKKAEERQAEEVSLNQAGNARVAAWNMAVKSIESEGHTVYSRSALTCESGLTETTLVRVLALYGYATTIITEREIDAVRAILAEIKSRQDAMVQVAKQCKTTFGSLTHSLRQAGFDWRITRLDDMPIAEWAEWKSAHNRNELPRGVTFRAWLALRRSNPDSKVRQNDAARHSSQQVRQDDAASPPGEGGGGAAL